RTIRITSFRWFVALVNPRVRGFIPDRGDFAGNREAVRAVLVEMAAFLGLPVGLLLGLVVHRGDFCMHSAVREVIAGARERQVRAYLLALGFLLLTVNALADSRLLTLALPPVMPAASIVGGLIFGLGMVMAKG